MSSTPLHLGENRSRRKKKVERAEGREEAWCMHLQKTSTCCEKLLVNNPGSVTHVYFWDLVHMTDLQAHMSSQTYTLTHMAGLA